MEAEALLHPSSPTLQVCFAPNLELAALQGSQQLIAPVSNSCVQWFHGFCKNSKRANVVGLQSFI